MKRFLYLRVKHSAARVAESLLALTPKVSLYGERDLYLEIGATAKLFGGEMGLLFQADTLLTSFMEAKERRWVVVDRPEWARSCVQRQDLWLPPGKSKEYFWGLPVARLATCGDPKTLEGESREREKLADFMTRVGLKKIGDFARLPEATVTHRFGELGQTLHAWASGKRELLPPLYVAEEKIQESIDGDEIASLETLLFLLRSVLVRFEAQLKGRGQAVKAMRFEFVLESSAPLLKYFEVSDPSQDASALIKVLQDFFRDLFWESPLLQLHIQITETIPHRVGQLSLFDALENRFDDLGKFVARLRGRFGDEHVGIPELLESYLPEKSWQLAWPPTAKPKTRAREFPDRPLFLLPTPTPLANPDSYQLQGAEDLWAEWWDGGGQRRYFVARRSSSPPLWIFLDVPRKKWFVHGTFD